MVLIEAKGIYLHMVRPSLSDELIIDEWFKDPAIQSNLCIKYKSDMARSVIESNAQLFCTNRLFFFFKKNVNDSPLGFSALKNIDWRNRVLEFDCGIGDEDSRNGYYGPELFFLTLHYVFNHLDFRKVYGYVLDNNKSSHAIIKFGGGVVDGVLSQHEWVNGEYVDVHAYSITSSEFKLFINENKNGVLRKYFSLGILK